jgi:peroxiredoxin
MRLLLITALALISSALGQTPSEAADELKYLMNPSSRVGGRHTKDLQFAGDRTAVELQKIYVDDLLAEPQNLRSVLSILQTSFEDRDLIVNAEDREPRATILLLRSMSKKVSDPRYRAAIDKLIVKLNPDATFSASEDYGCIDPLALPLTPIKLRKQAPDLVLRDAKDKPFRLSEYTSRPILLSFVDSTRPWSIEFSQIQEAYKRNGLAVAGILVDHPGGRNTFDAFQQGTKPDYPILLGSPEVVGTVGAGPLPMTMLIDRNGRIAAFQSSDGTGASPYYCTYYDAIQALLAEPVGDK